jgi:hypothetical protein
MKGFERLPEGVLHQIFRLVAIPLEPHRHPEEAPCVRERFGLESGPRRLAVGNVLCHLNPEDRPDHTRRELIYSRFPAARLLMAHGIFRDLADISLTKCEIEEGETVCSD